MTMQAMNMQCVTMLRLPDVMARTGLSRAAIYAKANPKNALYDETFPRVVKLGGKASDWVESEINEWLLKRIEQRNQQHQTRKAA